MFLLRRDAISYSNLTMTNEDGSHPVENAFSRYTQDSTQSTANSTTIKFDVPELSDVDLYNAGALDGTGNRSELVTGTVTIKDRTTQNVLATETIDFYTATRIAYASTNNLTYHRNIRAFHGDQHYFDVTVEIYLEADAGETVELGTIGAGLFVQYGRTADGNISPQSASYSIHALIEEYNNLLHNTDDEYEVFFHATATKFDGENGYMSYGIPSVGSAKKSIGTNVKYNIDFKV